MTSKEALEKMIEKYDWLAKEYCKLIENDNPYKANKLVFEQMGSQILQDLDRLEEIDKSQLIKLDELSKYKIHKENKYQCAIRVLKECFIALGKSEIIDSCWFKYLDTLEQENQELKQTLDILKDNLIQEDKKND